MTNNEPCRRLDLIILSIHREINPPFFGNRGSIPLYSNSAQCSSLREEESEWGAHENKLSKIYADSTKVPHH